MQIEIGDLAIEIEPATNGASKIRVTAASTGAAMGNDVLDNLEALLTKALSVDSTVIECKNENDGQLIFTAAPYRPEDSVPGAAEMATLAQESLHQLQQHYARLGSIEQAFDRALGRVPVTSSNHPRSPVVTITQLRDALMSCVPKQSGSEPATKGAESLCRNIAREVLALPPDNRNNPDTIRPIVVQKLGDFLTPTEKAKSGLLKFYADGFTNVAVDIMTNGVNTERDR